MIIRDKPIKDKAKFLVVNNEISNQLHIAGFKPLYISGDFIYYRKTKKIMEVYKNIIGGETVESRDS